MSSSSASSECNSIIDLTDQDTLPFEPPERDQIEIIDLVSDLENNQADLKPLIPDETDNEEIQRHFANLFRHVGNNYI